MFPMLDSTERVAKVTEMSRKRVSENQDNQENKKPKREDRVRPWKERKTTVSSSKPMQISIPTNLVKTTGKGGSKCIMPNCTKITKCMKLHSSLHHLPKLFVEELPPNLEDVGKWATMKLESLKYLARMIIGEEAGLIELVTYANNLYMPPNCYIAEDTQLRLRDT